MQHRTQRPDQRPGVARKRLQLGVGKARLVQERGEDPKRLGQRILLRGGRVKDVPGIDDQIVKLRPILIQRPEHHPRIADQQRQRPRLGV